MFVVEILVGLIVATVILLTIAKIGAPLAEAFAERLKLKYQELGPEEERELRARISSLEEEVRALQQQVISIQGTVDFAVKYVEAGKADKISSGQGSKIEIVPEQEHR